MATKTKTKAAKWIHGDERGEWFLKTKVSDDDQDAIATVHPTWGSARGWGIGKPSGYVARIGDRRIDAPRGGTRFDSVREATKTVDRILATLGDEIQAIGGAS
jgi:hypothetical protein